MSVPLGTAQRYRTLLEVKRAAITQPAPEDVFRGMCEAVKGLMPYDRAGLSLYQPEEDALKIVASEGSFADSFFRIGALLGRKESHDGWAFEQQRTSIILRGSLDREGREHRCSHNSQLPTKPIFRETCSVPRGTIQPDCSRDEDLYALLPQSFTDKANLSQMHRLLGRPKNHGQVQRAIVRLGEERRSGK